MKRKIIGGKRPVRISVSITNDHDNKLNRLAISCNMKPAELASMVIHGVLDNPDFVVDVQKKYNKNEQYKVTPFIDNGKVIYLP